MVHKHWNKSQDGQSFSEVQRHTHLYSTASYGHTHTQFSWLNSSPTSTLFLSLEPLKLPQVLELLLFIFIIKRNIILWLYFSNLSTKTASILKGYTVSCTTFCFAFWKNTFNLLCPGQNLFALLSVFILKCNLWPFIWSQRSFILIYIFWGEF